MIASRSSFGSGGRSEYCTRGRARRPAVSSSGISARAISASSSVPSASSWFSVSSARAFASCSQSRQQLLQPGVLAQKLLRAVRVIVELASGDLRFEFVEAFRFAGDEWVRSPWEAGKMAAGKENGEGAPGRLHRAGKGWVKLSLLAALRAADARVTARELLDPASGIDELLLAREKRVASGANADLQFAAGGAGVIDRAASARDGRSLRI